MEDRYENSDLLTIEKWKADNTKTTGIQQKPVLADPTNPENRSSIPPQEYVIDATCMTIPWTK